MILGIDLGTSSLKTTLCDLRESYVECQSAPSPISYYDYSTDISLPLRQALEKMMPFSEKISGIGIAAVAPALACVHYTTGQAHLLFSHLTPVNRVTDVELYRANDLAPRILERKNRTLDRLSQPAAVRCSDSNTAIVPLATLLGLLLAGREVHDAVNWYELGYVLAASDERYELSMDPPVFVMSSGHDHPNEAFSRNALASRDVSLAVTTDTVASAIGAMVTRPEHRMVYLGSFVGVAQFHVTPQNLVDRHVLERPPYTWQMSMPRFGQTLDNILDLLQLGPTVDCRFERLESILSDKDADEQPRVSIIIDASATGGESDPAITIGGVTPSTTAADIGLAFVERIADGLRHTVSDDGACFVSGGGAKTAALPRRLAKMANLRIGRAGYCWTSIGAAMAVATASGQKWPMQTVDYFGPFR